MSSWQSATAGSSFSAACLAVDDAPARQPAHGIADCDHSGQNCQAQHHFAAARQLVAEIIGNVAFVAGRQRKDRDLHGRRYKDEQDDGAAMLTQHGHIPQIEIVPADQCRHARELAREKRDRAEDERGEKAPGPGVAAYC